MIANSDFLNENIKFDKIERLDYEGGTCEAYVVHIEGKAYFMKRLRSQYVNDPNYRQIFNKEFEVGNAINNCYIPQYVSIGEDIEGLYILMEYVQGITLQEKLEKSPSFFDNDENVRKFIVQLLTGLKCLHNNNIAHLDITPRNIILCQINNNVKIIDLGFCMESSYAKTAGCTPGENMAPELKNKQLDQIDASTDLYEVGMLLVEIEKVRKTPLPRDLRRVKERCLQPKKEKRYVCADDIINRIKRYKMYLLLRFIACVAVIIVAGIGFTNTPLYTSACDYIAWETGKIGNKFYEDGVYYRITSSDARTVEVTYKGEHYDEFKYEYKGDSVNIPATVTHRSRIFRVKSIASNFCHNEYILKATIPNGIDTIHSRAFAWCFLNDTVRIPASVKYIGKEAFLPLYIKSLVVDGNNMHYDSRGGCNAIIETATNTLVIGCNSTIVPEGITRIEENAFEGITNDKYIILPASVQNIGKKAFYHARIKGINIPEGITRIEEYTFQWCENLQKIQLPQTLKEIGYAAFSHCAFMDFVIPDSVTIINDYAFDCNNNLQTVTIGSGVRSIGYAAFENCHNLKKVYSRIPGDSVPELESNIFGGISSECVLYVPRGAKSKYGSTCGWGVFSNIVETDF